MPGSRSSSVLSQEDVKPTSGFSLSAINAQFDDSDSDSGSDDEIIVVSKKSKIIGGSAVPSSTVSSRTSTQNTPHARKSSASKLSPELSIPSVSPAKRVSHPAWSAKEFLTLKASVKIYEEADCEKVATKVSKVGDGRSAGVESYPHFSPDGRLFFTRDEEAVRLEQLGLLYEEGDEDVLRLTELGRFIANTDLPVSPRLALMALCATFLPPFYTSAKHLEEILRGLSLSYVTSNGGLPWLCKEDVNQAVRADCILLGCNNLEKEVTLRVWEVWMQRKDVWKHRCGFRTLAYLLELFMKNPHDPYLKSLWVDVDQLRNAQELYNDLKRQLQALRKEYSLSSVQVLLPRSLVSSLCSIPQLPSSIDSAFTTLIHYHSHQSLGVAAPFDSNMEWTFKPALVLSLQLQIMWYPPYYKQIQYRGNQDQDPFFTALCSVGNSRKASRRITHPSLHFIQILHQKLFVVQDVQLCHLSANLWRKRVPVFTKDLAKLAFAERVVLTSCAASLLGVSYSSTSEESKERKLATYSILWLLHYLENLRAEAKGDEMARVERSGWKDPIKWKVEDWQVSPWKFTLQT